MFRLTSILALLLLRVVIVSTVKETGTQYVDIGKSSFLCDYTASDAEDWSASNGVIVTNCESDGDAVEDTAEKQRSLPICFPFDALGVGKAKTKHAYAKQCLDPKRKRVLAGTDVRVLALTETSAQVEIRYLSSQQARPSKRQKCGTEDELQEEHTNEKERVPAVNKVEQDEKERNIAEKKAKRDEKMRDVAEKKAEQADERKRAAAEKEAKLDAAAQKKAEQAEKKDERKRAAAQKKAEQAEIEEAKRAERMRAAAEKKAEEAEKEAKRHERKRAIEQEEAKRAERMRAATEKKAEEAEKEEAKRDEKKRVAKEIEIEVAKKKTKRDDKAQRLAAEKMAEEERIENEKREEDRAERERQALADYEAAEQAKRDAEIAKNLQTRRINQADKNELPVDLNSDANYDANCYIVSFIHRQIRVVILKNLIFILKYKYDRMRLKIPWFSMCVRYVGWKRVVMN